MQVFCWGDATQLYPYLMSQLMPTGLYAHWDFDSQTIRFTPRQNKTRSFGIMAISYFQQISTECKIENFFYNRQFEKYWLLQCWWVSFSLQQCVWSHAAEKLLEEIKEGKLFGYVQCDIEVRENFRSKFESLSSKFQENLS